MRRSISPEVSLYPPLRFVALAIGLTTIMLADNAPGFTAIPPAASITWGPATDISGDRDVSTSGVPVAAFNLSGIAGATTGRCQRRPIRSLWCQR